MSPPLWRQIQRQNFTRLDALADFLELTPEQRSHLLPKSKFPLNLPLRLAQKIEKGALNDPIFKQFVPHCDETISTPGFCSDPLHDQSYRQQPNLLSKYSGRSLLIASNACAMHCRYCFRKNFPYESTENLFSDELAALANDPTISEIVLSGGDPLSLSNESLSRLFQRLAKIPHLRRIRIHSRFPIGIPERIDEELLELFHRQPQQIIFVIHVNHPRELDSDILKALRSISIPVLSQSVLLHGVNDDESTLLSLYESLIDAGIIPYYLHLFDKIDGCAHFEVSAERGRQLIQFLQSRLPGYGVPRFVQEVPGKPCKTYI